MIDAIVRLSKADGSEDELDVLLDILVEAVPHASISDLIYYPEARLSPMQIADEALQREVECATKPTAIKKPVQW